VSNRFVAEVTRGAIRLRREAVLDTPGVAATRGGGGTNAGCEGLSTAGRVSLNWSSRSRRTMRWKFSGLPWELLGDRPAMITLTYPGEWRESVPDARAFVNHRDRLRWRWRKKFGQPIGVWVAEFQARGAPHLHLYVGLPPGVTDAEYRWLVRRNMRRQENERRFGKYEARRRLPAIQGDFSEWLRHAWWEIVGSGNRYHHGRGADIVPAYSNEEVAMGADRVRTGDYWWMESGKWAQKTAPEGFGPLGFYGLWGESVGFRPVVREAELTAAGWYELRRLLRVMRTRRERASAERVAARTGKPVRFRGINAPRGRDGLTVFEVVDGPATFHRLAVWAEEVAAWKAHGGDGGHRTGPES
jgi:hypothetical protein